MSGNVLVNGQREDKAGTMIDVKAEITVKGGQLKYVSRGGLKLEKAMSHFDLTLEGRVCMDVGASTGGFTDCMLQNGAVKVYSVDVGHGQLDWKLRNDPRVVCMEKTNIRYVTPEQIEEPAAFVSIDVSFISLTKVLPPVRELMTEDGEIVCLIKPQFEAGREKVGKKGVVRDPKVHEEVIEKVIDFAATVGLESRELVASVCQSIRPCCVIAVDALASRSLGRLCRTVQLADTGISPGSGVGNHRAALDQESLGVPVLAVGVPTVVEGATLAADLLGADRLPQSAPGRDILVTPRDIDRQVADLSKILGYGISMALQPGLGLEELELLLS